jgi:hypothetical protein
MDALDGIAENQEVGTACGAVPSPCVAPRPLACGCPTSCHRGGRAARSLALPPLRSSERRAAAVNGGSIYCCAPQNAALPPQTRERSFLNTSRMPRPVGPREVAHCSTSGRRKRGLGLHVCCFECARVVVGVAARKVRTRRRAKDGICIPNPDLTPAPSLAARHRRGHHRQEHCHRLLPGARPTGPVLRHEAGSRAFPSLPCAAAAEPCRVTEAWSMCHRQYNRAWLPADVANLPPRGYYHWVLGVDCSCPVRRADVSRIAPNLFFSGAMLTRKPSTLNSTT